MRLTKSQSKGPKFILLFSPAMSKIAPNPPSILTIINVKAIKPPIINKNPCITSNHMTASIPPYNVNNTTAIPKTIITV